MARLSLQAGEPFGVPYGDEGIFLATDYDDLTCVVLERVDRIERVMQYPSHWKTAVASPMQHFPANPMA